MKFYLIFFLLYGIHASPNTNSLTQEYYKKLINEGTKRAESYVLPTRNSEFERGFESSTVYNFGNFDFIIVGAGSAGAVLATRLSEISEWNILLLEAGGEENDFNKIPGLAYYNQFNEFNWGYYSIPQKNSCLGMINRECIVTRGKAIGGSSAINACIYVRGNKNDFDKWERLGNPGWSYKDVLPYFIKSENSQVNGDEKYHGKGGMWNVEYGWTISTVLDIFAEANAELNTPSLDFNGMEQLGESVNQHNIKHGVRQSTGTAFLDNARSRKNLRVITKVLVTRIIIDSRLKIARGVEFVSRSKKYQATASREVISSAGAINSPQLLMLSGIGPKHHLNRLDIQVIQDLPAVGENLYDHPFFLGLNFRTNYSRPKYTLDEEIQQYLNGVGELTSAGFNQAVSFSKNNTRDAPCIEYVLNPLSRVNDRVAARIFNLNLETLLRVSLYTDVNTNTDLNMLVVLLHPKSKGQLTLKSNSPIDFPNIDLNMFSEPEDMDTMIGGIAHALKILKTKAFQKLNATLLHGKFCEQHETFSRNFWECAVRHFTMPIYHVCGTTTMGPNKATSVVNANLEVHGIRNLRVVDAGVMPSTISGHTSAATVMIAEKISDVIKLKYNKKI